jgi:hypothetical protein
MGLALTQPVIPTLSALEAIAESRLDALKAAQFEFVGAILDIQASGMWQAEYSTWKAYLEGVWLPRMNDISYSRFGQLRAAYPVHQLIAGTTGHELSEGAIRAIKALKPEAHHIQEIVELAYSVTDTPEPKHFKAAYEIITEHAATGAISIGGESIALNLSAVKQVAMIEGISEAYGRQWQHIADSSMWQTVGKHTGTVQGYRQQSRRARVRSRHNDKVLVIHRRLK